MVPVILLKNESGRIVGLSNSAGIMEQDWWNWPANRKRIKYSRYVPANKRDDTLNFGIIGTTLLKHVLHTDTPPHQ